MTDKTTCWYQDTCYQQMLDAAEGKVWPVLEKSAHYPALKRLLSIVCGDDIMTMLDVGCGAGSVGNLPFVKKHFKYCGMDLGGVIENVAVKHCRDDCGFVVADFIEDHPDVLAPSFFCTDVVLTSGVIDSMEHPAAVLSKLLGFGCRFFIIHRQFLTTQPTYVEKHDSYGGFTYRSHINFGELSRVASENGYLQHTIISSNLGADNHSILLERDVS